MPYITPARFSSGVSTARKNTDYLGNYGRPMPMWVNEYYNDFNSYTAGDWTVAPATGTSALTASNGGVPTLTTGAVNGNGQGNALNPVSFGLTLGYQSWFGINFTCSDNLNPNWAVGLTAGGAAAPTSGIYFTKASASRNVSIIMNKGGTTTTLTPATLTGAAVDATALFLGWYYDGKPTGNIYFFSSFGLSNPSTAAPSPTAFGAPPIYGGTVVASASNDGVNPNPITNFPIVNCQPSFFIQTNVVSAARTMAVDYVHCAMEELRF